MTWAGAKEAMEKAMIVSTGMVPSLDFYRKRFWTIPLVTESARAVTKVADNHLSRKNYTGSAKGMEPDAAAQLVNNSEVLREVGLDVRALVGDDAHHDSATIAAIMKGSLGSLHKIFKLSCRVHVLRNYVKGLYTS